jgi:hypothetical protein
LFFALFLFFQPTGYPHSLFVWVLVINWLVCGDMAVAASHEAAANLQYDFVDSSVVLTSIAVTLS